MKKLLFLIIYCLLATQSVLAEGTGKIFLQHNGNITKFFNGEDINKAINAAADGDTLFLTIGEYNNTYVKINKSISLIGYGCDENDRENMTTIGYNVSICPEDEKAIDVNLEGIYFNARLSIAGNIHNLVMKKCAVRNEYYCRFYHYNIYTHDGLSAKIEKVTFDRCYIPINSGNIVNDLTVKNCKIPELSSYYTYRSNKSCKFINCNIQTISENIQGIFVNSIINRVESNSSSYLGKNATLINCLYHTLNGHNPMDKTTLQDCWSTTETLIATNETSIDCLMNAAQLKDAGYIGLDGTVVGIEGGVNPYSLTSHTPSIKPESINIDTKNKTVNININVTAN